VVAEPKPEDDAIAELAKLIADLRAFLPDLEDMSGGAPFGVALLRLRVQGMREAFEAMREASERVAVDYRVEFGARLVQLVRQMGAMLMRGRREGDVNVDAEWLADGIINELDDPEAPPFPMFAPFAGRLRGAREELIAWIIASSKRKARKGELFRSAEEARNKCFERLGWEIASDEAVKKWGKRTK
jgi:hypothetical protein